MVLKLRMNLKEGSTIMRDIWEAILVVFEEPVIDTLKILPLLFLAYLLMEWLEKKAASGMEVKRLLVNNMREVTADDARRIYQEVL